MFFYFCTLILFVLISAIIAIAIYSLYQDYVIAKKRNGNNIPFFQCCTLSHLAMIAILIVLDLVILVGIVTL